jgi:hypothetical protein
MDQIFIPIIEQCFRTQVEVKFFDQIVILILENINYKFFEHSFGSNCAVFVLQYLKTAQVPSSGYYLAKLS